MATIGNTALTLMDWAKRLDDNDKIATIIELLSQTNEILQDMLMIEGNLPTGHKNIVRTGIPSGTWRMLYQGVAPTKTTTATVVDTVGNLENLAKTDVDLADLGGNRAALRASEAAGIMEGMNQQMATTLFYGSTETNPERFTGLAPRYSTVTAATAQSAANVVDAGGTGTDNTSIWVVTWGERTTIGIFPKGKITGLQHEDLGRYPVLDGSNNTYLAYLDRFKWELGLSVPDWRYNVRIANIDVSDLATTNAANIMNLLVRAVNRLPTTMAGVTAVQSSDARGISGSMGRTVIYVNRTVRTYLELQAMNKTNVWLSIREIDGMVVMFFRGIPIRTCDAILNTESRVV